MFGDCAIALHRAACALDSLRNRLTEYGGRFFETEKRAKPYEDLKLLGRDMDELAALLSASLGDEHEAVVAFGSAREVVGDIVESVERLRDPSGAEVASVQKFVADTVAHVGDQRETFDACRDRFMAAPREVPGEE